MNNRLLRFGAVGIVGFAVDACTLVAVVTLARLAPLPARLLSFLVAATVTFALNQRFTFRMGAGFSVSRWISYLTTTAVGACINIGVYRLWVLNMGAASIHLVIGTAIGSIAAMFVNYFASSMLVFRPVKPKLSV